MEHVKYGMERLSSFWMIPSSLELVQFAKYSIERLFGLAVEYPYVTSEIILGFFGILQLCLELEGIVGITLGFSSGGYKPVAFFWKKNAQD